MVPPVQRPRRRLYRTRSFSLALLTACGGCVVVLLGNHYRFHVVWSNRSQRSLEHWVPPLPQRLGSTAPLVNATSLDQTAAPKYEVTVHGSSLVPTWAPKALPKADAKDPSPPTMNRESNEGNAAVQAYRRRIQQSHQQRNQHPRFLQCVSRRIHVQPAWDCLQRTAPHVSSLVYPDDAHEHMHAIRMALAPWAQHDNHTMHTAAGYAGPWIENEWITYFEHHYDSAVHDASSNDTAPLCLSDWFGPYIPIFVPWLDHWLHRRRFRYPDRLIATLRAVLRPNVAYITLSQNDEGLVGRRHEFHHAVDVPNLLVVSAGGHGHVPMPLFKQDEARRNHKPVADRTMEVSFVGSLEHAPRHMRRHMHETMQALSSNATHRITPYHYYSGRDWRNISADSRFSLVPRGFGRTSYHLMETLQMGLVPIHVYRDIPWVPYARVFDTLGFVTNVHGLSALVTRLQSLSDEEVQAREQSIVALRDSHFTVAGALSQLRQFMVSGTGDLICQVMPRSNRGL